MKTLLSIIVFFLVAGGVSQAIQYGFKAVSTERQVASINKRANDPNSEPVVSREEFRSEFMAGCDTGEYSGEQFDQSAYCVCLYDDLEAEYGVNKLAQVSLNSTSTELETFMLPYGKACLAEQGFEI